MRTIHFTLDDDQANDYNKIVNLTATLGITPKNFFLRAMRMELKSADLAEVVEAATHPKPRGRPVIAVDGYEKKEWIAKRIAAYNEAEKMAAYENTNHTWSDESTRQTLAEDCWNKAVAGESYTSYLKADSGSLYSIDFPRIEGE